MNNKNTVGWLGSLFTIGTSVGAGMSTEEIVSIILGVLGGISAIISICYTLYNWYKRVKSSDSAGGEKITKEELTEGVDIIKDGIDTIKGGKQNGDKN